MPAPSIPRRQRQRSRSQRPRGTGRRRRRLTDGLVDRRTPRGDYSPGEGSREPTRYGAPLGSAASRRPDHKIPPRHHQWVMAQPAPDCRLDGDRTSKREEIDGYGIVNGGA
jgi:hypothetical protein